MSIFAPNLGRCSEDNFRRDLAVLATGKLGNCLGSVDRQEPSQNQNHHALVSESFFRMFRYYFNFCARLFKSRKM